MKRRKISRSSTDYYLVGYSSESISGSKLPTLRQVLRYALYLKEISSHTVETSSIIQHTVEEVTAFWMIAGIKTILKHNAISNLTKIWKNWMALKKNRGRKTDPGEKRKMFVKSLDKLWDIGASDAIEIIKNNRFLSAAKKEEDLKFYEDQQGERIAMMSGRDKVFMHKIKQKMSRQQEKTSFVITDNEPVVCASSSDISDCTESSSEAEFAASTNWQTMQNTDFITLQAPKNVIGNIEVSNAIDRLQVTDNTATMLLAAFIKACKGDITQFVISRSSTRRSRISNRCKVSQAIYSEIRSDPPDSVALHWDGKVTENRLGEKYEALCIMVTDASRFTSGKVLGIQKIANASGQTQAEATFEMLKTWNLDSKVKALVFDTTASNSGWKRGAAKLLEDFLQKKVLYHACRHHVHELIIGAVWKSLFGATTIGPENPLFKQFKNTWQHIDTSKPFKILAIPHVLQERAASVIAELKSVLLKKGSLVRDDYKQCVTNTLALLGASSHTTTVHYKPGATHHARWMGVILYCQKM